MDAGRRDVQAALEPLRRRAMDLYALFDDSEIAAERAWRDELPALQSFVGALSKARGLVRDEIKEREEGQERGRAAAAEGGGRLAVEAGGPETPRVRSIRDDLNRLREQVARVEGELRDLRVRMNQAQPAKEMEICEATVAVLTDTRRLCLKEAGRLESLLQREEKSRKAQRSGKDDQTELAKLKEQLRRTDAKIDRAKQCSYFPAAKGYRFRAGSLGVYVGARDLQLSEISGGFLLEATPSTESGDRRVAKVKIHMAASQSSPRRPTRRMKWSSWSASGDLPSVQHMPSPTPKAGSPERAPSDQGTPRVSEDAQNTQPRPIDREKGAWSPSLVDNAGKMGSSMFDQEGFSAPMGIQASISSGSKRSRVRRTALKFINKIASKGKYSRPRHDAHPGQPSLPHGNGRGASGAGPSASVDAHAKRPGLGSRFLSKVGSRVWRGSNKEHSRPQDWFEAVDLANPHGGGDAEQQHSEAWDRMSQLEGSVSAEGSSAAESGGEEADDSSDVVHHGQPEESNGEQNGGCVVPIQEDTGVVGSLPDSLRKPEAHGTEDVAVQSATEAPGVPVGASEGDLHVASELRDLHQENGPSQAVGAQTLALTEETEGAVNAKRGDGAELGQSQDQQSQRDGLPSTSGQDSLTGELRRTGVFVRVHGEHVELVGEKGSHVPNMTVMDIVLEVECVFSLELEYSASRGWQAPTGITLEILKLKKWVRGNSMPLPGALIRTLLNMVLPKLVERAILASLPVELGDYIIEAGRHMFVSGDIAAIGPPLSSTKAILSAMPPKGSPTKVRSHQVKEWAFAREARNILQISSEQAEALQALFSFPTGLLPTARQCSISELSSFYLKYCGSELWWPLCNIWEEGLHVVQQLQGTSSPLSFHQLMETRIAALTRKPVRLRCALKRLACVLNVDAALNAIRDYFERSAREAQSSQGSLGHEPVPFEQQLSALDAWHHDISSSLSMFKSNFKSATCSFVFCADAQMFQVGVDSLRYEGPVSIKVPVGTKANEDGTLSFKVRVPGVARGTKSSLLDALAQAFASLQAVTGADDVPQAPPGGEHVRWASENGAGQGPGVGGEAAGWDNDPSWVMGMRRAAEAEPHKPSGVFDEGPLGEVLVHRLSVGISLNERNLADALLGREDSAAKGPLLNPTGVEQLLGCLGEVLSCSFGPASPTDGGLGPTSPFVVKLESTDLARLRVGVETLGFQSFVSPATLIRMSHFLVHETLSAYPGCDRRKLFLVDRAFRHTISYIDKQALDLALCALLRAEVKGGSLLVALTESTEDGCIQEPINVLNDVDLMTVIDSLAMIQEDSG